MADFRSLEKLNKTFDLLFLPEKMFTCTMKKNHIIIKPIAFSLRANSKINLSLNAIPEQSSVSRYYMNIYTLVKCFFIRPPKQIIFLACGIVLIAPTNLSVNVSSTCKYNTMHNISSVRRGKSNAIFKTIKKLDFLFKLSNLFRCY